MEEITMTKAEALAKQAEHVAYYAKLHGRHVEVLVDEATTAEQLAEDYSYPVYIINRHIPRGGAIEALIAACTPERKAKLTAYFAALDWLDEWENVLGREGPDAVKAFADGVIKLADEFRRDGQ